MFICFCVTNVIRQRTSFIKPYPVQMPSQYPIIQEERTLLFVPHLRRVKEKLCCKFVFAEQFHKSSMTLPALCYVAMLYNSWKTTTTTTSGLWASKSMQHFVATIKIVFVLQFFLGRFPQSFFVVCLVK